MAPAPGVAPTATTRPLRTVTSAVSVTHGAPRLVSLPQTERSRETPPQSLVNASMPPSATAYWFRPASGKRPYRLSTVPVRCSESSRARPSTPTPITSRVVVPGASPGPNRCELGTAALSARPDAISGPSDEPVAATPGCWVSSMSKKSAFTPATACAEPVMADTGSRAPTAGGCSRPTETRRSARSTATRSPVAVPVAVATWNVDSCAPGASARVLVTTGPDAAGAAWPDVAAAV
jgi:hypothetical protein